MTKSWSKNQIKINEVGETGYYIKNTLLVTRPVSYIPTLLNPTYTYLLTCSLSLCPHIHPISYCLQKQNPSKISQNEKSKTEADAWDHEVALNEIQKGEHKTKGERGGNKRLRKIKQKKKKRREKKEQENVWQELAIRRARKTHGC